MSEKSISKRVVGADESDDTPVPVVFTVDFLERTNVYLTVNGKSIAIPVKDMREACEFVLQETPEYVLRSVASLHVNCSYPMREDAIAMSDCCRKIATSAVADPRDSLGYLYRCQEHHGLIKGDEEGQAYKTVPLQREN